MNMHAIRGDIHCDVARMQKVVRKVTLDYISTITATDNELVYTGGRIDLHDVPKNGPAADFDHRLGTEIALFGDSRAFAACKNHSLHDFSSWFSGLRTNPSASLSNREELLPEFSFSCGVFIKN